MKTTVHIEQTKGSKMGMKEQKYLALEFEGVHIETVLKDLETNQGINYHNGTNFSFVPRHAVTLVEFTP